MITGFNTDVEHDGTVYHVQTEDKGLDSPLILSLVYVGGAILASKRSSYQDLIAVGFDETALAERLHRQHKLICAAINAGRIEDLKRMNQRDAATEVSRQPQAAPPLAKPQEPQPSPHANAPEEVGVTMSEERRETPAAPPAPLPQPQSQPLSQQSQTLSQSSPSPQPSPQTPTSSPSPGTAPPVLPLEPFIVGTPSPVPTDFSRGVPSISEDLYLDLLEERELRAGDFVTFRIRVSSGPVESRDAVPDADVTLKVLGTAFKPLVCSARTDQDGVAILFAGLPRFSAGRAAILIRASAHGHEAELRRIIQPV